MSLIVQKYGGTSVGSIDRIKNVAQRIAKYYKEGHKLVVVVSAMGDTTDDLIEMAEKINPNPEPREMDFLLSSGGKNICSFDSYGITKFRSTCNSSFWKTGRNYN